MGTPGRTLAQKWVGSGLQTGVVACHRLDCHVFCQGGWGAWVRCGRTSGWHRGTHRGKVRGDPGSVSGLPRNQPRWVPRAAHRPRSGWVVACNRGFFACQPDVPLQETHAPHPPPPAHTASHYSVPPHRTDWAPPPRRTCPCHKHMNIKRQKSVFRHMNHVCVYRGECTLCGGVYTPCRGLHTL